jgi:hypothetical protein
VPLGLKLFGTAFLPLLASLLAMAFNVLAAVRLQGSLGPGLTHGAVLGSLVLGGALSYRWTGRVSVAIGMVIASVCVTSLVFFLFLLWALGSAFD